MNLLTWDPNWADSDAKESSWFHGPNPYNSTDVWLAFTTATIGYSTSDPIATYKGTTAIHYQTSRDIVDFGTVIGELDTFYGPFSEKGSFNAEVRSINTNKLWKAGEYVK